MKLNRIWLVLGLFVAAHGALAQSYSADNADEQDQEKDQKQFSFTITPKMVNGILGKMADETSNRYGFDEDQKYQTREIFRDRLSNWLADNQEGIQKLMSGYVEGLLADEAPSPEYVADLAAGLRPLAEDFKNVMVDMSDEMGDYMTEDQLIQKEGEIAAIETMFTFIDQRLGSWEEGGFDPVIDHPTGAQFQQAERERQQIVATATQEARKETIDMIYEGRDKPFGDNLDRVRRDQNSTQSASAKTAEDKDPWSIYVREFVKKYELNDAQSNQCDRILRKLQEDRDTYLRRVDPRIVEIENRLTETPAGPARDQLVAKYEELAKPIETKFTLLKQKLNKIPTRAQRLKARASEEKPAAAAAAN